MRVAPLVFLVGLIGLVDATADPQERAPLPIEPSSAPEEVATLDEVLAANRDLWGDAALKLEDGPTFEFFAELLPPLRYVNAAFREVPVLLADPRGGPKFRVARDGSAIEPRGGHASWGDSPLPPATFWIGERAGVGDDGDSGGADGSDGSDGSDIVWRPFGHDGAPPRDPKLRDGWIPIVTFADARATIELLLLPRPSESVPWCVMATVAASAADTIVALDCGGPPDQRTFGDAAWQPDGDTRLVARLEPGERATVAIAVDGEWPRQELLATHWRAAGCDPAEALHTAPAEVEREWRAALGTDFDLVTPEARVNDAWRATLANTLLLFERDTLLYSARNGYHCTFEAECGDALRALWRFGIPGAERGLDPLLTRPLQAGVGAHDTSFKSMLLREWWQLENGRLASLKRAKVDTSAARKELVERTRQRLGVVSKELDEWLAKLTSSGLLPKQAYCGDIATPIDSLFTNATFWRALRDQSLTHADLGRTDDVAAAERFAAAALAHYGVLSRSLDLSIDRSSEPPFIPMALFGEEKAYPSLTANAAGSYWNLVSPYALASGFFATNDERLHWLLDYPAQHGGLCMGMVRFDQHSGLFANTEGVDDLYTLRRVEKLLELDRPDEVVVAFYGKLAQGMTRGTWQGGEGSSLRPLDAHGRATYLPPNAAANAFFLSMLRGMFVQEIDSDHDGRPDELRLASATPRHWLREPGSVVSIRGAPTSFGPVSFTLRRAVDRPEIAVEVEAPPITPRRWSIWVRRPVGTLPAKILENEAVRRSWIDRLTPRINLSKWDGSIKISVIVKDGA